jgi:branched-chain amino acid aminotransferase
VEERVIPVEDLMDADEVFCTGTAVVVNAVGSITYQGKRYIHVYACSLSEIID